MIKAAVFDLDHTLFDRYGTIKLVAPRFRETYEVAEGITDEFIAREMTWADKQFVHHGWQEIHAHLIAKGVFVNPPEYPDYVEFVLNCFSKVAVPFDFSIPMLKKLRDMGIKTGLITNGRHEIQSSKLKLLGLENSFDAIVISGDTNTKKPDPAIFKIAADRLGVDLGEMMYIGDHPQNDVDASRRAGCTPCWVKTTGTWIFPEIEKPELQVETVAEIPDIIERINKG